MATGVRYVPKGVSEPAIYTFLGLATLPRFRGRADGPHTRGARRAANLLRLHVLPREMVLHIARFAYRAGYRAHWVDYGNDEEAAVAIDADRPSTNVSYVTALPEMVSRKTYYVEVRFTYAWWSTGLEIYGMGERFCCMLNNIGSSAETGHIACFSFGSLAALAPRSLFIPSLGVDSWSYVDAPVTMSVLVDMVRGCATFGLNGLAGPCLRFPPGGAWRDGVQVSARGFPLTQVLEGGRCIISCATPPTPPSMLAAAASQPMTVAEHLTAGSLRTAAEALVAQIDINPPWVN